jgi:hypothetical protein
LKTPLIAQTLHGARLLNEVGFFANFGKTRQLAGTPSITQRSSQALYELSETPALHRYSALTFLILRKTSQQRWSH